jgi:enoyl-[acyl-carrier protein] reductase I
LGGVAQTGGDVLLEGKKILITGVLSRASLAYEAAAVAQREGAEIVLSSFGRVMSLTEKTARHLDPVPDILTLDVNSPEDLAAARADLERRWGHLDGFLHAIAFAPEDSLGGRFLTAPWESVQLAFRTSTYSLKALAEAMLPLMREHGGSIVTLDFDATVAWPIYDWMGVCKAGLESVVRYLARDLGAHRIRVNAVSAGPQETMAAKSIPGFAHLRDGWQAQAPLGWDTANRDPVARMITLLLSDWTPMTTGEIIHVDGGYHAMGAPLALAEGKS